ncbi:transcriptional regulator family: Fungal Specific TF [Penicillium roqueforti]|nr:transcriptional regulator family: Fungal Specific TF [Penicillium roqueforti]KAI3275558.1 transcriptional regulator family: Fungal Specific TF [Penicillium roqueforti]KAI3296193.1 transcriptional regulator family: Fungal Specific TF [Penicillium roqueforti]
MSAVSQSEADRVLHLKSREREAHACYTCRKRKVKCDGNQPCRTCQKRKHPEICTYALAHSRRRSASRHSVARSASPRSPAVASNEQARPDDSSKNYVYSGDNSVVSILRMRASDVNGSVARDVGSVLGLQNTFSNYIFMDSKTPLERWKSLLTVMPQRSEVLKFFHFYRVTAYPFNPILADIDRFESDLCTYLNAHASGEVRDPEKITDRWATDKSIGHISLLLATLAAGAHYSDTEYPERFELSTDFARRSFHALRLANFLFRPSLDIIQALLILGNTLQNMGQSDAAWALLGTTIRLAQTMGLHTERSTVHWPENVRTKATNLWSTIVWQDSLLCLCYDRPPIVSVTGWSPVNSFFERQDLSFAEVMYFICRIGLDTMRPESLSVAEYELAIEGLRQLDYAHQRGLPHLRSRENCTTLQQHLEHLALRMHTSFCVSVLCRPAMKQSTPQPFLHHADILRARAKGSLIDASRAFLDFQALSTVPLRTWSMVHTVLSSTLLLCIWEETRNDPECRNLQQKVIDVFSSSNSGTNDDGASSSESDSQWLSARHIRALVTLRSALDREQETGATETENWAEMTSNMVPQFGPGPMDMPNPFDVSPVTYLDSIMNLPVFDYTQENGFL